MPQHFVSFLQDYQGLDSRLRGNDSVLPSSYCHMKQEAETRMQSMIETDSKPSANLLPKDFTKPVYTPSAQRETVTLNRAELNCMVKSLELPNVEGLTPELKQAVSELTKVYFSESVPKLLPVKMMAVYLDNPEVLGDNNGLVKQTQYRLNSYVKADR